MATLALAAAAACLAIVAADVPSPYLQDALFWIPVIALANLTEFSLLPELDVDSTLGPIVIVAAAVLFPPSAVVMFGFFGIVFRRELLGRAPVVMSLYNHSMHALAGAAAATAAAIVYRVVGNDSWQIVPAALAGVISYEVVNGAMLAAMLVVRRGRSLRQALTESANPVPRFAVNAAISTMLSLLIAVLVRDAGRWAVVLAAIPLWLSHSAQRSARVAQDRAEELAVRVRELEMLNRLSGDLLVVRAQDQVEQIAGGALVTAAAGTAVHIDLTGEADDGATTVIPIAGAEPARIVVSAEIDGPTRAVFEAAASLVGMTLTRLEIEAELAETERARTALTGRILEEATHERSRIAMSVHDDVLPLFAAAQMQIDNADMLLEKGELDRADETIERATAGVSDGIRALRDTLEALKQSTLSPGTLVDGVRKQLSDMQARTGVRGSVDGPDPMPQLPFAVELLAYETVRGCLANVEKHAHATSVHVGIELDEGRLVVLMEDDGRGFDPTAIGQRSHGVALMRQRAELARGSFEITGTSGVGTTVRLEVPTW